MSSITGNGKLDFKKRRVRLRRRRNSSYKAKLLITISIISILFSLGCWISYYFLTNLSKSNYKPTSKGFPYYFGSSTLDTESYSPLGPLRFIEYIDGDKSPFYDTSSESIQLQSNILANDRKQHIKKAMEHAWNGYKTFAWGHDEVKPISKSPFDRWGGLGTTLVDSLDTLWIMGMKDEFYEARDWVKDHLNFDRSQPVSVFETTIRSLGGLLSAYDWSGDETFLDKAEDLGQRLLKAFDDSSGVSLPFGLVNLKYGHRSTWMHCAADKTQNNINERIGHEENRDTVTQRRQLSENMDRQYIRKPHVFHGDHKLSRPTCFSLSEIGSMQIEFRYLARATGKPHYEEQVMKAFDAVQSNLEDNGVYPTRIAKSDGKIYPGVGASFSFAAEADSFYEYMLKLWLQGNKKEQKYRDMYDRSIDAMHEHLLKKGANGLWIIGTVPANHHQLLNRNMQHLTCFMGGT